ncbi:MAG TPA: nucleotidyltransferase family protein [Vicinamibacterales bacterium]|nr:nucleotidyltransferase family protein [Vicinamibacterales bacterium]
MQGLLTAILRGELLAGRTLAACDPDHLRALAEQHGVLPLVAERLARMPQAPQEHAATFAAQARREAAADVVREVELLRLVAGLADAGIPALVMKGAQLAYSHYSRPDLRPRMDTDLIVSASTRPEAHQLLVDLGYEPVEQVAADLVMYQAVYVKRRDGVPVHAVDLHWRLANPQPFGTVLTYDEMAASAVPIAPLGTGARGLSHTHALLVACIHPIAHHPHAQRLIWHHDIHLLASRLPAEEWDAFTSLAVERRVSSVCRRSLELAVQSFNTSVPAGVLARLSAVATADAATAAYLSPSRRQIHDAMWDFQALPTWGERLRLVRQHLFPPASYMRDVYAPSSTAPLPVLYARRAFRGARRWLGRA